MSYCLNNKDWIIRAPISNLRSERIEAFFANHAYKPHRHDTYAIGRTLSGVQSFHYRGNLQHSLPGMTMVLHPDEKHDGESGTLSGFRYRMIYIEPAMIQKVLGGKPLPFIHHGLSHDPRLFKATNSFLQHLDNRIDIMEEEDALYDLATILCEISNGTSPNNSSCDYRSAEKAKEFILAYLDKNISLEDLEKNIGRDRWSLSRDFRLFFGTSPHRYMIMRRLETVKICLMQGESLVNASIIAGFFDQSHMTRHFIQAFGLTPSYWKRIHLMS